MKKNKYKDIVGKLCSVSPYTVIWDYKPVITFHNQSEHSCHYIEDIFYNKPKEYNNEDFCVLVIKQLDYYKDIPASMKTIYGQLTDLASVHVELLQNKKQKTNNELLGPYFYEVLIKEKLYIMVLFYNEFKSIKIL